VFTTADPAPTISPSVYNPTSSPFILPKASGFGVSL